MIIDKIINFFFLPVLLLLELLPDVQLNIPTDFINTIQNMLSIASYLLPLNSIVAILTIKIALRSFKIVMALISRVKSFFPSMGM